MPARSTKEWMIEAAENLPADATLEDAMERLCFLAQIEQRLEQDDAGMAPSHEEIQKRLGN